MVNCGQSMGKITNRIFSMLKIITPAALAFALVSSAASAQSVSANDPWSVLQAVKAYGHEASLSTDSYGDPKVEATEEGITYTILFYRCSDNANCEDLQFRASYEAPEIGTATMNTFNLEEAIGKAYVTDNDSAIVEHYVIGVQNYSIAQFDGILGSFLTAKDKFETLIGW